MTAVSTEAAWTDYWTSVGAGAGGGCLPNALRVESALSKVWADAARPLPRAARVLDLATGDGAVLKAMRTVRPDLKLTGVDSAASLPPAPKGVALRAGVAMEALPFAAGAFVLVTSQFGLEYGDRERITAEVARILAPGGQLRFVLHHAGSPVVLHNEGRRRALLWALEESGLVGKAQALTRARARMDIPTPPVFAVAPADAQRLFPAQTAAAEFATALWRTVEMGRRQPAREGEAALDALVSKARHEIVRIDALLGAASDRAGIDGLRGRLNRLGLSSDAPEVLSEAGGAPLGWLVKGAK